MRHLAGFLAFVVASAAPLAAFASSGGGLAKTQQAVNAVPEPAALALFAVGALVVGGAIRRYRRSR